MELKLERLKSHVDVDSFHDKAVKNNDDLTRQDQSIAVALPKQSDIYREK